MELSAPEYEAIRGRLRSELGIELGPERRAMVRRRLGRLANGPQLVESVVNNALNAEDLSVLADALTTNHTHWGREAEHFELMSKWIEEHPMPRPLRVWCAASSTGEEPYTLWIVTRERKVEASVLATDISDRVLSIAREGIYDGDGLHHLPVAWRRHFKHRPNGRVAISPAAKRGVLFRRLNLMTRPFPFKKDFDIIFCRNVTIYFDDDVRRDVVKRITRHLAPGGLFFMGLAESLPTGLAGLERVAPSAFRKTE